MTTPSARIEFNSLELKRLIGIDYAHFLALVSLAKQRHLEKQAKIEKRKVRIVTPGSERKPETLPAGIYLCLAYLRQKLAFDILGLLFDISKTKAQALRLIIW